MLPEWPGADGFPQSSFLPSRSRNPVPTAPLAKAAAAEPFVFRIGQGLSHLNGSGFLMISPAPGGGDRIPLFSKFRTTVPRTEVGGVVSTSPVALTYVPLSAGSALHE